MYRIFNITLHILGERERNIKQIKKEKKRERKREMCSNLSDALSSAAAVMNCGSFLQSLSRTRARAHTGLITNTHTSAPYNMNHTLQ